MNGSTRREFLYKTTASAVAAVWGLGAREICAAGESCGISGITRSPAKLRIPPSTPSGQTWRYTIPVPFQLAPRKAAVMCNIRGTHPGDFEVGTDFVPFGELFELQGERALSVTRIARGTNPNSCPPGEPCRLIKQWLRVGFVPLGARRADGSPHPHAGTGFGINEVIAWPFVDKQALPGTDSRPSDPIGDGESYSYHELHQLAFDGHEFRIVKTESIACDRLLPGWSLGSGGMTAAVSDGDDLVIPFTGGSESRKEQMGLLRWRRQNDGWRPVAFLPARLEHNGPDSFEPSLLRASDGTWFLAARGGGARARSIRVWRSEDDGSIWRNLLYLPGVLPKSPVSLHQAADGSLFVVANLAGQDIPATAEEAFPLPMDATGRAMRGRIREILCLWPLDPRTGRLQKPLVVRDGRDDFGPPPGGITWTIDHPLAANLQLSDGQWHSVLGYRVVDRAETDTAFPPPSQTGTYLEEVRSSGKPRPAWLF